MVQDSIRTSISIPFNRLRVPAVAWWLALVVVIAFFCGAGSVLARSSLIDVRLHRNGRLN